MPTEFLTDEQEQAYGHYVGPPSTQQLSRYFHLDDADRERVNERCGADNKLGFAVQLTTVRFLGTFLAEPTDVPSDVVAYVAAQLGIRDLACLADYAARPTTAWEHAAEIRRIYGYCDFTDPAEGFRLVRWLYTRAWLSSEQPSVLFDLATARLVERQVLLPGVSILTRLVARIPVTLHARWRSSGRLLDVVERQWDAVEAGLGAGSRHGYHRRNRASPEGTFGSSMPRSIVCLPSIALSRFQSTRSTLHVTVWSSARSDFLCGAKYPDSIAPHSVQSHSSCRHSVAGGRTGTASLGASSFPLACSSRSPASG